MNTYTPSLEDIREKAMKTINIPEGPHGVPCTAIQLKQGDTIQNGDWYLVTGHMHSKWCRAEARSIGRRIIAAHWPHIRIIA